MRAEEPTRWQRFLSAVFAAPRPIHLVLLIICFVLGFVLVTQVRAASIDPLESMTEEDLVVLLSELDAQEDTLRQERNSLQAQVQELENAATQQEAAAEAARRTQEQASINAGLVPVYGPGVLLRVSDPLFRLDSAEFVLTLGELRNAGAEAIELNGIRVSMRSAFSTSENGVIVLDGHTLTSPYDWRIIGDADTISTALEIQAGAAAQMRAKGAQVSVIEADNVAIEAVAQALEPQYATVQETQ